MLKEFRQRYAVTENLLQSLDRRKKRVDMGILYECLSAHLHGRRNGLYEPVGVRQRTRHRFSQLSPVAANQP